MGTNAFCNMCQKQGKEYGENGEAPIMTPRRQNSFDFLDSDRKEGIAELYSPVGESKTPKIVRRMSEIKIQSHIFVGENQKKPSDYYHKISLLGVGGFGSVMKVRHTITGEYRAMKIIKREDSIGFNEDSIFEEIKILKSLDHPNIIKIYEFFQDQKNFYLITEYCDGGDLFTCLTQDDDLNSFFTERIIRSIMRQVFSAVVYLHSKNIMHGDLKLENILLDSQNLSSFTKGNSANLEIKLIDFGCSKKMTTETKISDLLEGTINYLPPEVFNEGKIHKKNDLWATGVMLYIILTGNQPFEGKTEEELIAKIKLGKYNADDELLKESSKEVKDLVRKLLEPNIDARMDAKQAMRHKWFQFQTKLQIDLGFKNKILTNLRNLKQEYKFQQAVTTFIMHNCIAKEEITHLRKAFKVLDLNGDGRLSKQELEKGFKDSMENNLGDIDVSVIMKLMNGGNNKGYIEYEEFLQATIDKKKLLSEKNLKQAFSQFDIDGNGGISAEEIRSILGKDAHISQDVFEEILKEVGLEQGKELSFEEFKSIMEKVIYRDD